jgi:fructose-1-phosphate kinase PfkB-like protein
MGPLGSVFVDGETSFHVEAEKVVVVDTTGAGDCFLGSIDDSFELVVYLLGSLGVFLAKGDNMKLAMQKVWNTVALLHLETNQ